MKQLTKAEEQIMHALWNVGQAYLKDIIDELPEPKPHNNTVATVLKVLMEKEFVTTEQHGRNNLYKPLISKQQYSQQTITNLVNSYFDGEPANVVSFLVNQKKLKLSDLELLLKNLKK